MARACLLNADAVVNDDGGEVDEGVIVVAAGDAAPLLEVPEAAFDGVAIFVQVGVARSGLWLAFRCTRLLAWRRRVHRPADSAFCPRLTPPGCVPLVRRLLSPAERSPDTTSPASRVWACACLAILTDTDPMTE